VPGHDADFTPQSEPGITMPASPKVPAHASEMTES